MTARHVMSRQQQSDRPATGTGNVHMPQDGTGRERGGHGGRASLATAVTTARPIVKKAAGVGAAAAGVAASRLATSGMAMARRRRQQQSAAQPASEGTETPRVIQLPDSADSASRTSPPQQ
jgi:hypothetical protein